MRLSDLPSFERPAPTGAPRVERLAPDNGGGWDRTQFLRTAVVTAVGVGVASLGIFPPARRALASHAGTEGYQILQSCPSYASGDDCSPGCGPSPVDSRACVGNSSSHWYGWHRASCNDAYGFQWKLRPNACVSGTSWDGWRWSYNNLCGCCTSISYRCHDGWRCSGASGGCQGTSQCDRTICRWIVSCTHRPSCV